LLTLCEIVADAVTIVVELKKKKKKKKKKKLFIMIAFPNNSHGQRK